MSRHHQGAMKFDDAVAVSSLWQAAGGKPRIELAALEPLLWHEGDRRIPDLVFGVAQTGASVSMTTNGSHLDRWAVDLKQAGLNRVRVSWHTTDPELFRQISSGGNYRQFFAGITAAANANLPIAFNRTLIRGYDADIPDQLDWLEEHGCRIKFHDLLWTPETQAIYAEIYQDWRQIVRRYVLPRTEAVSRVGDGLSRRRIRFCLPGGACVEVKVGDRLDRACAPCRTCAFAPTCREAFGDYVRVEPDLSMHFCYLRRDISVPLAEFVHRPDGGDRLRERLRSIFGARVDGALATSSLRYIVVPYCNFCCVVPGTSIPWCHKTSGNYAFRAAGAAGSERRVA